MKFFGSQKRLHGHPLGSSGAAINKMSDPGMVSNTCIGVHRPFLIERNPSVGML